MHYLTKSWADANVKLISYEVTFHDGRKPVIFDISTPEGIKKAKTEGFDLKESEEYKTRLEFTVEGDKISGLYQTQEVFREGRRHSWDANMLISLLPKVVSFRREAYFKKKGLIRTIGYTQCDRHTP